MKSLILVAIKGNYSHIIFGPSLPAIIQSMKKQLLPNYKGWILQIRSPEAYKIVKILPLKKKLLTYEEKLKLIKL